MRKKKINEIKIQIFYGQNKTLDLTPGTSAVGNLIHVVAYGGSSKNTR
jgi:hypothetical protein